MSYAGPTDMISRFDVRTLGDLCADNNTRVTAGLLETNPKMIAALDSAAGQINAACLQGERYSVSDLAGLLVESKAHLININCIIAMAALWRRRHYPEENQTRTESLALAETELTRLRTGEHVFDVVENKIAGRADVTTVSRVTIEQQWELVNDRIRGHLLPPRRSFRRI